jgi:hypothetical protein
MLSEISSCPGLSGIHDKTLPAEKTLMAGTSSAKARFALLPGHDEQCESNAPAR